MLQHPQCSCDTSRKIGAWKCRCFLHHFTSLELAIDQELCLSVCFPTSLMHIATEALRLHYFAQKPDWSNFVLCRTQECNHWICLSRASCLTTWHRCAALMWNLLAHDWHLLANLLCISDQPNNLVRRRNPTVPSVSEVGAACAFCVVFFQEARSWVVPCLSPDPGERPNINMLLNQSFFIKAAKEVCNTLCSSNQS